ncbi:MAG: hypothetical protein AUJ75_02895 [Candidatus Omnitrophica bacterium CG1_02_49_10]|nr:MAG: hypothetical protein AUJ75_02895 [Candidatus Omnitrophica bacterium CG1_02_49_10]
MARRGFLLLEVVVSIAILSLGAAVILRSFVSSARADAIAGDILNATYLAEEKLSEFEMPGRENMASENGQGDDGRFQWLSGMKISDEDLGIAAVDVIVKWRRGNKDNRLEIASYFETVEAAE